jgi:hypothetical protein
MVEVSVLSGGHLDDIEPRADVRRAIDEGKWTHVVLQGTKISSSHKFEYSQAAGIALAARARRAGAKVLLFAEWPRKGWDESDYIFRHYQTIQESAGGEIVPVCYAWDEAFRAHPSVNLWAPDGNHSSLVGAYLAACTIAYWVAGTDSVLTFVPRGVDTKMAGAMRRSAMSTVEKRTSR